MKIESSDKTINKIFSSTYIKIPRFQRPFCWEKEEIDDFLNDIIFAKEQDYFVGSMVMYKIGGGDYLGIVDGQQRLTTTTLILCSIRNIFNELSEEKFALGIQRLIERENISFEKEYVLQTESSFPYFQEHIQKYGQPVLNGNNGPEEELLKIGFVQIYNRIKDELKFNEFIAGKIGKDEIIQKLQQYRDKLLSTKVIQIELDSESDAYIIFETLNTRGKELEADHLIKNYIMKSFTKETASVDAALEKWKFITKQVQRNTFTISDFIYYHWLSLRQKNITSKKLYKAVLDNIVTTEEVKSYLDSLHFSANQFAYIIDPKTMLFDRNSLEIHQSLVYLNSLKVKVHIPMSLSVIDNWKSQKIKYKVARDFLKEIEIFHHIFTGVCSKRTSGTISSLYAKYAIELNTAITPSDVNQVLISFKKALREKYPAEDEYVSGIRKLWFTNEEDSDKKSILYALNVFQVFTTKYDTNYLTIEHVYPQSKINECENVGTIGNLIIVDQQTNLDLDTKDFNTKKSILSEKGFLANDYILTTQIWNKDEINKRTDHIARSIYKKFV